ncbi:MAG: tRNA lysidine(34) synthetase TilS, partial [Chlorobiales bacterium]|nr:tRNA lysidine(34) synthetase TilS [Chlorobiales bacterium]
ATSEEGLEIPREPFTALNIALQRRVLRRAILRTAGSLRKITSRQLEAIRLAAIGEGPAVDFVGYRALPNEDRLAITEIVEYPDFSYSYSAKAGQTVEVKEVDKSFALRIIEAGKSIDISGLSGPGKAFLDADLTGDSLEIRNWLPGDRYKPLGGPGHQKLQDVFVNARVERNRRGGLPVFVTKDRICWVNGFRIADEFKVSGQTRRILSIEEV